MPQRDLCSIARDPSLGAGGTAQDDKRYAHRTIFGYGNDIIGMAIEQTVAPEGKALLGAGMQEVFQQGSWRGENVNLRKDGTTFPVEASVFTVLNEAGELHAMVGILRDITERKQADEQVRIVRTMIESSPYAITISSLGGSGTCDAEALRMARSSKA